MDKNNFLDWPEVLITFKNIKNIESSFKLLAHLIKPKMYCYPHHNLRQWCELSLKKDLSVLDFLTEKKDIKHRYQYTPEFKRLAIDPVK